MKGQATLEYVFLILFSISLGIFILREFETQFLNKPNNFKSRLLDLFPFQEDRKNFDTYILFGID